MQIARSDEAVAHAIEWWEVDCVSFGTARKLGDDEIMTVDLVAGREVQGPRSACQRVAGEKVLSPCAGRVGFEQVDREVRFTIHPDLRHFRRIASPPSVA